MNRSGHCLCGAVTFSYEGSENWRGYCHCDSCRRATASPVTTFMGVQNGKWRWTGKAPQTYVSSKGVIRSFCGTCGAQVSYQNEEMPDEIHFYAALLDDPENFLPEVHFHWEEHLPWLAIEDDLPKRSATDI